MLENDFNLICRWRVFPMTSYRRNVHMAALCINRLLFQFEFAPNCAFNILLSNEQILDHF